jgi:hypothetical protein
MSQSDYYSQNSDGGLKDKVADAADAVQQASVDAYESVRDTAQEQPFISGLLVGALVGFALGALWKLESRRPTCDLYRSWKRRAQGGLDSGGGGLTALRPRRRVACRLSIIRA